MVRALNLYAVRGSFGIDVGKNDRKDGSNPIDAIVIDSAIIAFVRRVFDLVWFIAIGERNLDQHDSYGQSHVDENYGHEHDHNHGEREYVGFEEARGQIGERETRANY